MLEGKNILTALFRCFERKEISCQKMEEQVDAGRAKTIGLSNYTIAQIQTVLKSARIKPANLQVEIHVYFQQHPLVDFCHKNGITVVAYSPLGSPGYNKFLKNMGQE
jgi:alcohol dehydrogenase (NADP+)